MRDAHAGSALTRLFAAARSAGGEGAVRAELKDRSVDELRRIARALERLLGERSRRWHEERIRDGITGEIMRRAFRNDVFLRH